MKDDNPRGGREHMIMPSHTLTTRPVTVDDMINWLRLDGFNRGLVGWSTQFSSEEVFGCPSPPTQGQLLPESQKKAVQGPPPGNADASLCAALDRAERQAEQEKEIRRKIQQHRGLIPAAVREVERRLVTAGVPIEEVRKLGRQDAASSVFVKLGRLEQIQRPVPPPPARVRIQVVCDIYGMFDQGRLWKMDLYIPRNCLFDEFEDILQRHAYVKSILEVQRVQTPERTYDPDEHAKARAIKETKPHKQVLRGKYVRAKVWGYKIVGTEETGLPIEADGHWIALCDQEDFTKLMKVVVRDASKIALICHVCLGSTSPEDVAGCGTNYISRKARSRGPQNRPLVHHRSGKMSINKTWMTSGAIGRVVLFILIQLTGNWTIGKSAVIVLLGRPGR